jgi:hypothetical protein
MHKHWPPALVIAALVVTAYADTGAQAQSVTRSGQVTVVRGNDHPEDRRQYRSSRGEGGVSVVRGNRRALPQAPQPRPQANTVQTQVGGKKVWFIDPAQNRVVGCDLQRDVYGKRYVDCVSGGY